MTAMTQDIEQELLQTVRRLPAARAEEVLDFAQFLATRIPAPAGNGDEAQNDWDRQAAQIDREQRIYERRHSELLAQYHGRYIAMLGGKVVDHDMDRLALRRRIRKQHGNTPVFFTLVEDDPIQTFWMRSPQIEIGVT